MKSLIESITGWLEQYSMLHTPMALGALLFTAVVAYYLCRLVFRKVIHRILERTPFTWDEKLLNHQVFSHLVLIVPAIIIWFGISLVPGMPEKLLEFIQQISLGFGMLMAVLAIVALLTAANLIYEQYPVSREKPIKGYIQVAKILVYIIGLVLVVAALLDKSPLLFLSGFGAMTAVLMFVFKDTILSLIASIQITSTEMIRLGDWIEMPQFGADGDVIDIALHTVRIQNWDKTVTSVPTHKFVSDAFKNWRFMGLSGGRRMKRSLYLDISGIRFLEPEDIKRLREFAILKDYIDEKLNLVDEHNRHIDKDPMNSVNARRLTNLGTFRAYVYNFLKSLEEINQDMTLMVRQLASGPTGVPLEIYAFSKNTAWAHFEGVQADIFDHLFAILPQFGLRVFQQPSGADFSSFGQRSLEGNRAASGVPVDAHD